MALLQLQSDYQHRFLKLFSETHFTCLGLSLLWEFYMVTIRRIIVTPILTTTDDMNRGLIDPPECQEGDQMFPTSRRPQGRSIKCSRKFVLFLDVATI